MSRYDIYCDMTQTCNYRAYVRFFILDPDGAEPYKVKTCRVHVGTAITNVLTLAPDKDLIRMEGVG